MPANPAITALRLPTALTLNNMEAMLSAAVDRGLQVILLSCDLERCQAIAGARQIRLGA